MPKTSRYFVVRDGLFIKKCDRSILFMDGDTGREFFIPVSLLEDWWFTFSKKSYGMSIDDLEYEDNITVKFPKWLAKREGILGGR